MERDETEKLRKKAEQRCKDKERELQDIIKSLELKATEVDRGFY